MQRPKLAMYVSDVASYVFLGVNHGDETLDVAQALANIIRVAQTLVKSLESRAHIF